MQMPATKNRFGSIYMSRKGSAMHYDVGMIDEKVKKKVNAKRYVHTLGVAYTASSLAMCHGADVEAARVAGLLHDYAKCLSDEKMLEKCKKHGLAISAMEKKNPYLLHGKLAAWYAEHKFEITDRDILMAITYHTTGREQMCLLEKIVFVADFIEPNRKMLKNLPMIRKASFADIDEAVYLILRDTLGYLSNTLHKDIDEHTRKAYEWYSQIPDKQ